MDSFGEDSKLISELGGNAWGPRGIPDLVGCLGEGRFGPSLLSYLNTISGVEHCAVFQVTEDCPVQIETVSLDGTDTAFRQTMLYLQGDLWRADPSISDAQSRMGQPHCEVTRQAIDKISHAELRERIYASAGICERIVISATVGAITVSMSALRTVARGSFQDSEVRNLQCMAPALIALACKHVSLIANDTELARVLTELPYIQERIALMSVKFPKREAEVCARILYGMSTVGIALELGIGEETVMTYRKRVYERLSIGSYRELQLWYLEQLGTMRAAARRYRYLDTTH